MSDRLKLAERCEIATGPDREIDKLIAWGGARIHEEDTAPRYTASLDAAMTLVGNKDDFRLRRDCRGFRAIVWAEGGSNVGYDAEAPTLALALCAAALKARAASADRSRNGQDAQRLDAQHESAVPRADEADAQP